MKLNLICGKSELRPSLQHVKITKDKMYPTDTHALVVIPTNKLFDEQFISKIPDEGFLIFADDYKKLLTPKSSIEWKGDDVIKVCPKNKRPILVEIETEDNIGKYPNIEAVIPQDPQGNIPAIGINFEVAYRLQQAMGGSISKLYFTDMERVILVKSDIDDVYGAIMPCAIK